MPFTVNLPKLSPTMESGVIVKWLKKEGERVKAGEVIFEVATDKATVEHEALDDGFLRKILVKDGEEAIVNQPVAIFTAAENESIEGFQVAQEPPKATPQEKPAESSVTTVAPKAAQAASTGLAQPTFAPEAPLQNYQFSAPRAAIEGRVAASPLAKKVAREKGLDLSTVQGSGPGGRIVADDLEKAQPAADISFGPGKVPEIAPGTYEEEKLSPMRRVIGQRLQEAKTFIPHFYVRRELHVEALVAIREQLIGTGVKLTYNDFVIRACALALRKHPIVNSAYNTPNGTIAHFKTIDICVAVTIDGGLITPIIRHADYKNLGELSTEVRSLATRAKAGKLQPEEYKGGSFTISNLGMYGVDDFIAVINPPQAAILAVGSVKDSPVVRHGQVVAGKVLTVVLSADHRVVDGVEAAKFLQTLAQYIENPASLLLPA
ncbi:MAG: pyruvate dehydrogenase complex dihydrolipoamide acetyltransferase [Chlamydiales bacterium]|nr:pyruvate dehydrogenase complex dihydrolipoamide acetyltransferase [Chlamydiales bacterium]